MYLVGNRVKGTNELLSTGVIGLMNTPKNNYLIQDGWAWAADNGCFGKGYPGDDKWLAWLTKFSASQRKACLFATAPDVVANAAMTLERSRPWLPVIRNLGYPAALVAQDGLISETTPWDSFDVLFIGGSTKWKLGDQAKALIVEAKRLGKPVHVGRVNSQRRFLAFAALGAASVDGTYLGFGPEQNTPKLLSWIRHHQTQSALFSVEGAGYGDKGETK